VCFRTVCWECSQFAVCLSVDLRQYVLLGVHTMTSFLRVVLPAEGEYEDVALLTFSMSSLKLVVFEGVGETVSVEARGSAGGPKR
jgi:hypothetical protein